MKNFLTGIFIAIVAIFSLSSFGYVPNTAENRIADNRESSVSKREDKKQARLEQRRERLEHRMEIAKTQTQKDRIQRKIDRTERPNKLEIFGLLALIFGAVGLGLALLTFIFMWFIGFWLWYPAFILSVAGVVLGILGLLWNDDKGKAKWGLILGAIGLALLLTAIIIFYIIIL